jgi:glycosyltransferase involved in cell wall biosynthesis
LFEPVSIIVCTRNRPVTLRRCLESLLKIKYETFEIIIVDNAPANKETFELVSGFPFRYIREDRPGLDWARNRGISEARYDIIAFTDDDAIVDAYWLEAISNVFFKREVMAVTGYVAPAELSTASQYLFEFGYGGMSHGLYRKVFRRDKLNSQELIGASRFGVGANMAFRREIFTKIGDFDVALDVGTPSGGGGDIDMFHRVVTSGHVLMYEPSMLVWHKHRTESSLLRNKSSIMEEVLDVI